MNHFFGYISLDNKNIDVNVSIRMKNSMNVFSYDKEAVYEEKYMFICDRIKFNRAEFDSQPLLCKNNRYVIAASCRLDNRKEIADNFQIEETKSDHECILDLFTRHGSDALQYLLGDFSFIVWDKQEKQLFLAKDHLGVKPLFYYKDEDVFIFATNINAIKAALTKHLPINKVYVAKELRKANQNHEDTFFEGIHRVKPAHFLQYKLESGQLERTRYWELQEIDISNYLSSETTLYEELRRRFEEAVRCRIKTKMSVGCQLSGGLDSSAIAVILSRIENPEKIHTYSFVLSAKTRNFSDSGIDEQGTQNTILDATDLLRANHHKIEEFHYKDVFDQFDVSTTIHGGFADSDSIWQDTLFKKAAQNKVGVILSGFPGDECVSNGGSLHHYDIIGKKDIKRTINFVKEYGLVSFRRIAGYYFAQYRGSYIRGFMPTLKKRNLLRKDSAYQQIDWDYFSKVPQTYKELIKRNICGTHTCLRMESEGLYASQYGIETAYPMADIRLVEFIYSLPIEAFKPKPYTRAIFRNICKGILPESVRLQQKFNGAKTLAFADYWNYITLADLKNYTIEDRLEMYEKKKEVLDLRDTESVSRKIRLYTLDYFINKHLDSAVNAS